MLELEAKARMWEGACSCCCNARSMFKVFNSRDNFKKEIGVSVFDDVDRSLGGTYFE